MNVTTRLVLLAPLLAGLPACVTAQALQNPPAAQAPAPAPAPSELEKELAQIRSAPQVEKIASKFASENDLPKLQLATQRLVELRPHNGNYRYTLAATHAQQDHKREAYDALVRLQNAGYAYEIEKDERFKNVRGTEVWDYLVQGFEVNRTEFGEGKVAYTLPAGDFLIESLAWDPAKKQLLAGSAREGKVFRVGKDGALEDYVAANAENGMWSVMDLAVDAPRDALWVAASAIPHFKHAKPTDYGKGGVFRFELSTGKFVSRHELPPDGRPHIVSSIAVTPKGDVFFADGVRREIWKLEGGKPRFVINNERLSTIRGMAASDRAIYFADYELGLFGLDLATGEPFEVRAPENVSLYAIDGLSFWNGQLIAVQGDLRPKRVMRFELTPDGTAIAKHQALEASRKAFGTPTRGVVAGETFYFIANTQKPKYDSHGLLKSGAQLEPTKIMASDVRLGIDQPGAVVALPKKK
jgi:hypothetical protein